MLGNEYVNKDVSPHDRIHNDYIQGDVGVALVEEKVMSID